MELVSRHFELAGSRVYTAQDKQTKLNDDEVNALSAIVQACQTKDKDKKETSLLKARAFCNMDAGRDVIMAPAGIMTLHDPQSLVTPDMISDQMFQYLCVVPINHPEDLGDEYTDAYFQTDEQRARLNEAIPQYSEAPYSLTVHRSRRDNRDRKPWEAELGQDNAWAGVIKARTEDGEDCEYYVVARAGSPYACNELRAIVADRAEGATQKPMTWAEFDECQETSAARANAQLNARRLAFNVGLAMGVTVPNVQDGEAAGRTKPSMAWGEKMVCQHVSTVDEICVDDAKHVPNGQCIGVFNEVTPSHKIDKDLYVASSGAGPMLKFHMDEFLPSDVGVPCTTGRKLPLPENARGVTERYEKDDKLKKYHAKAKKRFIWEGQDQLPFHPDINPNAHYSAVPRKDQTFVDQLCGLGWNRRASYDVFTPVMVKLCNPYKKRPKQGASKASTKSADAMAAFD